MAVVDPRVSLASWLRAGRTQRGMTLEDVSRVTKIQLRLLERLESGRPEGLPAEVFVRGFVRSFAKCVGLDEDEALRRYSACAPTSQVPPTSSAEATAAARAMVEAMADLAPVVARAVPVLRAPFASGSLSDLPRTAAVAAVEAVVETVLLPSTGTLTPAVAAAEAAVAPAEVAMVPAAAIEAPVVAIQASVELAVAVDAVEGLGQSAVPSPKKRTRKGAGGKGRGKRKALATGTPAEASPIVAEIADDGSTRETVSEPSVPTKATKRASRARTVVAALSTSDEPVNAAASDEPAIAAASEAASPVASEAANEAANEAAYEASPAASEAANAAASEPVQDVAAAVDPWDAAPVADASAEVGELAEGTFEEPIATATWRPQFPKLPPAATTSMPPWRRPRPATATATATATVVPTLVIDDADPESAEQVREERAAAKSVLTSAQRRSFLPPILLDREDRSARQGGLTLAVIILLIAATLTLSYLMRRPSSSGDGVTQRSAPAQLVG